MASALAGLRVLDLTQHIAGPYATKLLADNGADVIKIEPPRGDIARTLGPFPGDEPGPTRSALFTVLNAGKRAMTLDLQSESVRAVFAEMAAGADLVVESFRPGTLAKLGFSYEELTRLNPRVVLVSISNFGQTGPFSQYEGSDLTLYAIGAELHSVGIMGREPVKQHGTSMLYQSGAIAAGAAMGAAFAARRDGIGQWVDVAITETHAAGVDRRSETLIGYNYTGRYAERTEGVALGLPAGVYPCKDGYLEIDWLVRDWSQVVDWLDGPEELKDPRYYQKDAGTHPDLVDRFHEVLLTWLNEKTMLEAWEKGQAIGVPCGPIYSVRNLLKDGHLAARDYWGTIDQPVLGRVRVPGPPFRLGSSAWLGSRRAPVPDEHAGATWAAPALPSVRPLGDGDRRPLPLEGVRVLDLAVVWAGPFGTQILADLGAEVIKIESSHFWSGYTRGLAARPSKELSLATVPWLGGYPDDEPNPRAFNKCAGVVNLFRNKHSATMDLRGEPGRANFLRLVEMSDVLYENNATPTMAKLGLDYETLRAINPRLVMLRAPAFGLSGPYRDYRALGPNVEGFIGHSLMRGYEDTDASSLSSIYPSDYISGAHGAFAVIAALYQRETTGEGQLIELPQVDSAIPMFTEAVMDVVLNDRLATPIGNRDIHGAAPQGCYRCAGPDDWLALTVADDERWQALCRIIERPDLAADAGLATAAGRMARHDELDAALNAWTATLDKWDAFHRLQAAGVAAAPVLTAKEAWDDPQLRARNWFERVSHPDLGDREWPGMLYNMSETRLSIRKPPVGLGEDNEYVYRDLLGVSDAEWDALVAAGEIAWDYDETIP